MVAAQGFGSKTPTALRAVAAETTAAKAKDPNWKAPKTAWGHPDLEGIWTSDDMRSVPTSSRAAGRPRESRSRPRSSRAAPAATKPRAIGAVNQETILAQ